MVSRHRLVVPLTAVVALLLFALAWLRHLHFGSHAYDLGAYENSFYHLGADGTPYNAVERVHQWGNHFEVGLVWLYLPYRLAPSPAWLLALQAVAVATCALPVEAIARRALGDATSALMVTAAVWLTPQLVLAHFYDFHALTVCALPIATMAYGIERDRPWWVFLSALGCMSLREPMALAVAACGVAWVMRHGRRRAPLAATLTIGGMALFLLQVLVIIPHYAGGRSFRYASQYGRLGGSAAAAVQFLLTQPWRFMALPFEGGRLLYLLKLAAGAAPFAGLALLSRRTAWPLVIAAPLLLVQLLNDRWEVWNIHFHYGSVLVPLLAIAAALALGQQQSRRPQWVHRGPRLWLLATASFAIGAVGPELFGATGPLTFTPHPARWQAIARVAGHASVCTQQDLLPHLADRPIVHSWPRCDDDDQFIVLDNTGMSINPAVRSDISAAIARLRADPTMRVRFDRDGAFVAERR